MICCTHKSDQATASNPRPHPSDLRRNVGPAFGCFTPTHRMTAAQAGDRHDLRCLGSGESGAGRPAGRPGVGPGIIGGKFMGGAPESGLDPGWIRVWSAAPQTWVKHGPGIRGFSGRLNEKLGRRILDFYRNIGPSPGTKLRNGIFNVS